MPYRIAGWSKEQGSEHPYEPPTREVSGDGPLKWVRSYVWGHSLSDAYRTLLEVDHLRGLAAFGAFHKLLEIAADEPRQLRDGTLYRHGKPATLNDLAFLLGVSVETAEPMISALIGVGWLVQTTEPVKETTEPVKQTTEPVEALTGGAEKRRTELELEEELEEESLSLRAREPDVQTECPFDGTEDRPVREEQPVGYAHLVPQEIVPDLANLFGITGVDSVRLDRVGLMIHDHGLQAVRHAIDVTLRKERRSWGNKRTLDFMAAIARNWTPDEPITPSPRVAEALADQEAERMRRRKRAEAAAAKRGLIQTKQNELEKQAGVVF